MFHGSAPVRNLPFLPRSFATPALKLPGFGFLIRITVTVPARRVGDVRVAVVRIHGHALGLVADLDPLDAPGSTWRR